VMLARGDLGVGVTGHYFAQATETRCAFAEGQDRARRLYEICQQYCRMPGCAREKPERRYVAHRDNDNRLGLIETDDWFQCIWR